METETMENETLLVVEDNTVMLDGLRDILSLEGFNVLTAANGLEGLTVLESVKPDMIISDIAMPEMDGFEFYECVRSKQEWVTIPFVFLTARSEKEDVLKGKDLGVEDYLIKPLTRDELVSAVHARLNRSQQIQLAMLKRSYDSSLSVLANAIDVRDPYTFGHVERVTAYALAIGKQLGWQGNMLDKLRYGSILHDIGKIFINEATLLKEGPLTEGEWLEIKQHPNTGANMVEDISYLAVALPIVRHHHERWDGKGYPNGLAGEQIPIAARIVAVADCFDAMTIDRPYRAAFTLPDARQEILNGSGTQFDPQVVQAFDETWVNGHIEPIWQTWQELIPG